MKRFLIAYFFSVFFFLTFFSSGFVDSQDGLQYLTIARRMYYDQTFQMPDADFPQDNIYMSVMKNSEGKRYSPTGLGYSLALLPAVAVEDYLYRMIKVEPIVAFPLANDWPVLLFASMTNAVFGALFVVTLYAYIKTFDVDHWPAVAYSFIGLVSTNLFPYTKHTFAHMIFVSFLTLSFYYLRKFGKNGSRWYLAGAGWAFGGVIIAYNPTYLLPLPALGIYYLLQKKYPSQFSVPELFTWIANSLLDGLVVLANVLPLTLLYWWFNQVRLGGGLQTGYGRDGIPLPSIPEAYVFIEGFWGLLFSPGKSIFLFSPLLILFVTHWFKISKKWKNELIAGSVLFVIYFYFMGTLLGDTDFLLWHGESSWGPRYMLPTIPLLYIVCVGIMTRMSRLQKWLLVVPLVSIGLVVQLTGMLLPYQTRFAGLETDVTMNGRNHTVYEYGNQIPRYSPLFNQFKRLLHKVKDYPKQLDHGQYNLILKDGFVRPFHVWENSWREPLSPSLITFENSLNNPVREIEFRFRNHQMQPSGTASAQLNFTLNDTQLNTEDFLVENNTEKVINFSVVDSVIEGTNSLILTKDFISPGATKKTQILFLQSIHINGEPFWLGTVDYPYVSPVSKELFGASYMYFGEIEKRPWEIWHEHSGLYEETFDIWWLRSLHSWDLPARLFLGGFLFTVCGWVVSCWLMVRFSNV